MLIEANTLTVVRQGRQLPTRVPSQKLWLLAILSVTTAIAYTSLLWRRRGTLFGIRRQ